MPQPSKKLILDEIKERQDKGLCFHYDKKFRLGHRCKRLFYLEGCLPKEDEEDTTLDDVAVEIHMEVDEVMPKISLRVTFGAHIPQTMHGKGNMSR